MAVEILSWIASPNLAACAVARQIVASGSSAAWCCCAYSSAECTPTAVCGSIK